MVYTRLPKIAQSPCDHHRARRPAMSLRRAMDGGVEKNQQTVDGPPVTSL